MDALVCLVGRFDKGGDVVRAGEPFDRQRDLQVPHLEQVARLDPVLSPEPVNASPPEAVGERFGLVRTRSSARLTAAASKLLLRVTASATNSATMSE